MEDKMEALVLSIFASLSVFTLIPVRVLLTKVDEFSNYSSLLQQILHTFACFSLSYAFLFSPLLRLPRRDLDLVPPRWCYPYLTLMLCYTLLYSIENGDESLFPFMVVILLLPMLILFTSLGLYYMIFEARDYTERISTPFYHLLGWVIFMAFTSIIYHEDHIIRIEFDNPFYPYVVGPTAGYLLYLHQSKPESRVIQVPLWIKIVVGIVGNILANHYLKDKGYPLFWLIVLFTIFLMGNVVMIMESTCHTAIFGFLVGAIVDIAGEIFGLNIYMWLVGGVCAALLVFFVHLDEYYRRYYDAEKEELSTLSSKPSARLELPSVRQELPSVRQELLRNRVSIV